MAFDTAAWQSAVTEAVEVQDERALAALWREGQQHLGEGAGVIWARTISGLDASAVTG